eukprot:352987-Chlamydomonas_euryale.AAC.6
MASSAAAGLHSGTCQFKGSTTLAADISTRTGTGVGTACSGGAASRGCRGTSGDKDCKEAKSDDRRHPCSLGWRILRNSDDDPAAKGNEAETACCQQIEDGYDNGIGDGDSGTAGSSLGEDSVLWHPASHNVVVREHHAEERMLATVAQSLCSLRKGLVSGVAKQGHILQPPRLQPTTNQPASSPKRQKLNLPLPHANVSCMPAGTSVSVGAAKPMLMSSVPSAQTKVNGPKGHRTCAHLGCPKYAQLASLGVRRYCSSHMRLYGLKPKSRSAAAKAAEVALIAGKSEVHQMTNPIISNLSGQQTCGLSALHSQADVAQSSIMQQKSAGNPGTSNAPVHMCMQVQQQATPSVLVNPAAQRAPGQAMPQHATAYVAITADGQMVLVPCLQQHQTQQQQVQVQHMTSPQSYASQMQMAGDGNCMQPDGQMKMSGTGDVWQVPGESQQTMPVQHLPLRQQQHQQDSSLTLQMTGQPPMFPTLQQLCQQQPSTCTYVGMPPQAGQKGMISAMQLQPWSNQNAGLLVRPNQQVMLLPRNMLYQM